MTEAVVTASPLTRLVNVIEYLHYKGDVILEGVIPVDVVINNQRRNVSVLGGLVAFKLDMEAASGVYTPIEMNKAYGEILNLANDAREFINNNSGTRSKAVNLSYIDKIIKILGSSTTLSPGNVFAHGHQLSRSEMEHIAAMEDNLRAYNNEIILSQEKIDELISQIDHLTELVREIDIDIRLKDRMIQILGVMRMQSLRINVVGANDIMDGLDMYLGQLVRVANASATASPEKRAAAMTFVQKSLEIIKLATATVDAGQKFYPLIQGGLQALGLS